MKNAKRSLICGISIFVGLVGLTTVPSAQAQTFRVLHSFTGTDGACPVASLIRDPAGNLYSTTYYGGAYGLGTVFKLDKTGKETVLYSFTGGTDGSFPAGGVIRDAADSLYGTTIQGGDTSCSFLDSVGCGTVFKLDTTGTESVLYDFGRGGLFPSAGLFRDHVGNLYGTAYKGGGNVNTCDPEVPGCGTVFKVDATGKETVLYSFNGEADGDFPAAGLVPDAAGNLYGISGGGADGLGTVYKLDKTGKETVLYTFTGKTDGASPTGGLVRDSAGNLYGTTYHGGVPSGYGVVFRLDPSGNETVLYSFAGGTDGANPLGGVVRDAAGNLYGTTQFGGTSSCAFLGSGCGTVFKVDTTGKETILYTFTGGTDGAEPRGGLLRDAVGNLGGTTTYGGAYGQGVVFVVHP